MFTARQTQGLQQTTTHKVVIPFYAYAALSILVGLLMLFLNLEIFDNHHFFSKTLAITHIMALGWGSMIIFGASYQLLPVIIASKLYSNNLAYLSFIFSAIGIPILITGFYIFDTKNLLLLGGILINIGVIFYLFNVVFSIYKSKKTEVRIWFMLTSSVWLFSTTFFGLILVLNFHHTILVESSLSYLNLHAHMGIVGWFLLMILGVGSRLIPMFLISQHQDNKALWKIFILVNSGLVSYLLIQIFKIHYTANYFSILLILIGFYLFGQFCYRAYRGRIRKKIDFPMRLSLISVVQMILPLIVLLIVLLIFPIQQQRLSLLYGFCIFFGWITSMIFGMTFKTLPFIIWNSVYHKKTHQGKTPAPKDLFDEEVYRAMMISYIIGFGLSILGIILEFYSLIWMGVFSLLISAILYVFNSIKIMFHKQQKL